MIKTFGQFLKVCAVPALLTSTLVAGAAQAETNLTLVAYPVLFQENYTKAVIEPFLKDNPDIKITYFAQPTAAQMLGTLRAQKAAPQADVVIMDLSVSKAGSDEGLFVTLDEKDVPNMKDLAPGARVPGLAGAGVTFDNLVLMYNTELVKEAPTSWMALADPAFKGKEAIPAMPDIIGLGLTVVLDRAMGGTDYLNNVDKGIEALMKIAPNVQTWDPKPEVYVPVVNGQAALGVGWNARTQLNNKISNGRIKAVLPKEGSLFQANAISLVAGSKNQDAAKKFINYALSPEAQARFTEAMFYAPTNTKAKAMVSEEAIQRTALANMDRMQPMDWVAMAAKRDAINEMWRRKVIPLSR